MAIRLALNVELIRLRELRSIPVRRGGPGQDHLIGRNVLPSQLDILSSAAEEEPDWRQVAQHFFDRGRHEHWLTRTLIFTTPTEAGPALEDVPILGRHTKHLGDDFGR